MGIPVAESDRAADAIAEVRRIVGARDLRTVFQPIVNLETREVVAYEALSRGPLGSLAEMPDTLFGVAADIGLTSGLDRACVASSLENGRRAGLIRPFSLFVNVEANTLGDLAEALPLDLDIVVEITERDLLQNPGLLLRSAAKLRDAGLLIAMDDVGSDPASLALMPLLRPDIIKLDLSVLQQQPSRRTARVMDAVSAYREQFDAVVVAEGVETEQHIVRARSFGATLGQGWLLGRPSGDVSPVPPLGVSAGATRRGAGTKPRRADEATPFAVASRHRTPISSTKPLLIETSKFLEECALGDGSATVFATFQHDANFNSVMRARYARLAAEASLVAVFVQGGPGHPESLGTVDGLRVCAFDPADELALEWSVIVLSPNYAAMLSARQVGEPGVGDEFDFVLTHDRRLVIEGAMTLALRL